jgi:hypothetical protein
MPAPQEFVNHCSATLSGEYFEKVQYYNDIFGNDGELVRSVLLFDGDTRGRGIVEPIIETAIDYGFEPSLDDKGNAHTGMDDEFSGEACDESIEFLNGLLQDTTMRVILDGSFYLYETKEDPNDSEKAELRERGRQQREAMKNVTPS